jgi:hypothetical protein
MNGILEDWRSSQSGRRVRRLNGIDKNWGERARDISFSSQSLNKAVRYHGSRYHKNHVTWIADERGQIIDIDLDNRKLRENGQNALRDVPIALNSYGEMQAVVQRHWTAYPVTPNTAGPRLFGVPYRAIWPPIYRNWVRWASRCGEVCGRGAYCSVVSASVPTY